MIDDVGDGLARFLLNFVLVIFRLVKFVAWDLCFDRVGWYFGWPFLRIVTLGHFPQVSISEGDKVSLRCAIFVDLTGIGVVCSIIAILTMLK